MHQDIQLRAAARAIFDTVYPSDDWTPCSFDEAERRGTIHFRQSVQAAQQMRMMLADNTEQLALPIAC